MIEPAVLWSEIVESAEQESQPRCNSTPRQSRTPVKMLSRAATRTTSAVARRGFHTTRPRMSSPYHYPEGPYSNLPFNPRSKWFGAGYWAFMATGFFAPFGIAVYQTYKTQ
ncbi:hypothetical protein A0O28_0092540 [Trichoderma guizhouense]|uniref:Cytochrome c oxidase subunit 8, mitochondrial n=1 Tax=Trichoderma guizhouense TaxID=1491466 RepID=A0A1T3CX51_9HYPO|nr:hypothetical protein A0O28_0092540 [Trichoderma guizhouense]